MADLELPEDYVDLLLELAMLLRIELLTTIDGVDFDRASADRVLARVAGHEVPFIGRQALIENKRAAGRPKDLVDVAALEEGSQS